MRSSIHLCVLPSGGLEHSYCIRFVWHEVCERAHLHMTGTFSPHAHTCLIRKGVEWIKCIQCIQVHQCVFLRDEKHAAISSLFHNSLPEPG